MKSFLSWTGLRGEFSSVMIPVHDWRFLILVASGGFFVPSNELIQGYSIVLSLLVIDFLVLLFMGGNGTSVSFAGALWKSMFIVGLVSAICVLFLIPARGRVAEFLLWHAISLSLLIITLLVALLLKSLTNVNLFWWVVAMVLIDFIVVAGIWLN
jgi:hypothetical protein